MKKIILLFAAITIMGCKAKQETAKSKDTFILNDIAKVQIVNGTEAYIMNLPLRTYEVVKEIETTAKFQNILKDGSLVKTIKDRVIQFISMARKLDIKFDAVLYTSAKTLICIKFTDMGNIGNIGLARIEKISGIPTFVMCEPAQSYDVLGQTDEGLKLLSIVSLGLASNNISEDVYKMVDNLKNNKGLEACLITGTTGEALKFKR